MNSPTSDLNSALTGYSSDREWPFKIMMGGFVNSAAVTLCLVNQVFVPLSFALLGLSYGYILKVLRQSIKGEMETLPAWSGPVDQLVSGLSWMAICVGFAFFVLSLLAINLIFAGQTQLLVMSNPSFLVWAESTFIVAYIVIVFFKFFLALLMANFAEESRMLSGFAWLKIMRRMAKNPGLLLTAWLAGLTISALAVFIPMATVIGSVLMPFLSFLAEVIAARMIGQAWRAAQ